MNAYSYGSNNPITKKDPEGRFSAKALVDLIENMSRLNDISRGTGSFSDMVSAGISGSNMSQDFGGLVLAGGQLLLPPVISVPLMLGEGAMYTADKLGANTPEARARFNQMLQSAQQSRDPIQQYTSGYQAPSIFNLFKGGSSGNTPRPPSDMSNFKGTWDLGGGYKWDYGKGQLITPPSSSGSGDGANNSGSGSSGRSQTMIGANR